MLLSNVKSTEKSGKKKEKWIGNSEWKKIFIVNVHVDVFCFYFSFCFCFFLFLMVRGVSDVTLNGDWNVSHVRRGALYSQQLAVILSVKMLIAASC